MVSNLFKKEEYINYKGIYESKQNKQSQPEIKYNFLEVAFYVIYMILIFILILFIAVFTVPIIVMVALIITIVIFTVILNKIKKPSYHTGNGVDLIFMDANPNIINLPYLVDNYWTSLGYKQLSEGIYCRSKVFIEYDHNPGVYGDIAAIHNLADYNLKINVDNDNNKVYIICWVRYEGYHHGADKKLVTTSNWTSPYLKEFQEEIDKFYELLTKG